MAGIGATLVSSLSLDMKRSPNDDASPALLSINFILLAVVVVTTSLRLYTRFSLRALGWDDYTITATALLATTRVAIQAAQVQYGNGKHCQYISNEDYVTNNMLGWYAQLLLFVSMTLLKISIGLLLLRIRNTRVLRIFLCCLISGVIITNLTCVIILLSECSPVSAYWNGGGNCWDTRVRIYAIYIAIGEFSTPRGRSGGICSHQQRLTLSSRIFAHDGLHMLAPPTRRRLEGPDPLEEKANDLGSDEHGSGVSWSFPNPSPGPPSRRTAATRLT